MALIPELQGIIARVNASLKKFERNHTQPSQCPYSTSAFKLNYCAIHKHKFTNKSQMIKHHSEFQYRLSNFKKNLPMIMQYSTVKCIINTYMKV